MIRYALGIIEHPVTKRWQPWVYVESDMEEQATFACMSSHDQHDQALLISQLCQQAIHRGTYPKIVEMIRQSAECQLPDPLPQVTMDALMQQIANQLSPEG